MDMPRLQRCSVHECKACLTFCEQNFITSKCKLDFKSLTRHKIKNNFSQVCVLKTFLQFKLVLIKKAFQSCWVLQLISVKKIGETCMQNVRLNACFQKKFLKTIKFLEEICKMVEAGRPLLLVRFSAEFVLLKSVCLSLVVC